MADNKEDLPHPVDIHVGARIRLCRSQLRLSQGELASRVGVSFQAIQKYEMGEIRISASRLYEIAQVLGVVPGFFFEDYPGGAALQAHGADIAAGSDPSFDRREIMTLVRGFYGIKDKAVQRDLLRLITRMGNSDEDSQGDGAA